ncbi:MAG: rhodanese-like domain-containing protein [Niabella sp.]
MPAIQEILHGYHTLIDVRTTEEYNLKHIDGSINIPILEIPKRLQDIKQMTLPIVVYCLSGGRSAAATNFLRHSGISEVHDGGGIYDVLAMMA